MPLPAIVFVLWLFGVWGSWWISIEGSNSGGKSGKCFIWGLIEVNCEHTGVGHITFKGSNSGGKSGQCFFGL